MEQAESGVAFSGGGIRSAAFCSGVLRRLLQRDTKIDYLSCVSGGGYTGTAYLDWKYRHGKTDDKRWHQEFFDNMRRKAGLMCNWQRPIQGVLDTIVMVLLVLFCSVVIPAINLGVNTFPMAYAIDFLFGNLLRAKDPSCDEATSAPTIQSSKVNDSVLEYRQPDCQFKVGSAGYKRITLFATLGALFLIFYLLGMKTSRFRDMFYSISVISGLLLAITGIPFFIYFILNRTPIWMQLLIVVFSIMVWFFFPVLRRKSSFVLIVYLYAYVVYWKVYELSIFGVDYSDMLFYKLLFVSGIALWIVPALAALQERLVHIFNRWRLQKAFYTDASVGSTGCGGIGFSEIFLTRIRAGSSVHYCDARLINEEIGPLTLDHLKGIKPQYISNIVVNEWRLSKEKEEPKYELLTMSPTEIERLDRRQGQDQFEHKLHPRNVDLSDAMAASAAAVGNHMGAYGKSVEGFKELQTLLGLSMGAAMVSDVPALNRENCCVRTLPSIIEIIRVLPLVVFPLVYFTGAGDNKWVAIGVFAYILMLLIVMIVAVWRTGDEHPGCFENVSRWFIVHVPVVRILREMMGVPNQGPMPPPILRLSDGGHIENLAILPLLKKRLKKIVVVDGGLKEHDSELGGSLLKALSLAREKLHCSFIGLDGRDVIEDVKEKFVNKLAGQQPRSYRFKVHYFHKDSMYMEGVKVGEGEVLLLSPRHPDKGVKNGERVTWKEALRDIDVDLEAANWGTGPQQDAEEVDTLTFCCCECCHGTTCHAISGAMCGAFPQHNTANQFFTPRMFSAYHREGYYACVDAGAAEFLGAEMTNTVEHETGL